MDRQMEIEEILANIEEILEQAKSVPFSDKAMVDRDELFDLITDIRLKLPTEIEQSKWVLGREESDHRGGPAGSGIKAEGSGRRARPDDQRK